MIDRHPLAGRSVCLLVACAALALVTTPACKRPDPGGDEASGEGGESEGTEGEGEGTDGADDEASEAPDDGEEDGADDEGAKADDFDPGPARLETFPDDGWSEALAEQWLPDTLAVVVASPANLLDALDTTRNRLSDPNDREAFESLLARLPPDFVGLVRSDGWRGAGLDPTRPVAVWLGAGPAPVLDVFDALQKQAVEGGGDAKTRGTQIHTALQQLVLHLRISLPYTDHEDAGRLFRGIFGGGTRPLTIQGYEKAFAAGRTIVAMRREGTRLVIDAVASQDEDPVLAVAAHLTSIEAPEPSLPRPDSSALVWAGIDMGRLRKLDALYGTTQGAGSRPEGLVRAMTAESPFEALSFGWTPDEVVMRGHFSEPQADVVGALSAAPRLDRAGFGSDTIATLELLALSAAQDGPWADLGFIPPGDELAEWKLEAFVGKSGPIVFALPLWLPMLPAVGLSFAPPDQQHLDPGSGAVLQLALPSDFSLAGPTFRTAITWPEGADPAQALGCLVTQGATGDACPPIATGEPVGAALGGVDLNLVYEVRDGTPVLVGASTPDALSPLRSAAINTPSDAETVRVFSLRVDASSRLLDAFLPPADAPTELLAAIGWLQLDLEIDAAGMNVRFGTGDGRPLLTPITDALVKLWQRFVPTGGEATARAHIQRIGSGALVSYGTVAADGTRAKGFPAAKEPACVGTGTSSVDPSSIDWESGPWERIGFRAWAPFDWKYCYQTSEDAQRFALWADLDLDDDGTVDQRMCAGGFVARGAPVLRMMSRGKGPEPCVP